MKLLTAITESPLGCDDGYRWTSDSTGEGGGCYNQGKRTDTFTTCIDNDKRDLCDATGKEICGFEMNVLTW